MTARWRNCDNSVTAARRPPTAAGAWQGAGIRRESPVWRCSRFVDVPPPARHQPRSISPRRSATDQPATVNHRMSSSNSNSLTAPAARPGPPPVSAAVTVHPGMHALPRRRPVIPPTEWVLGSNWRTSWAGERRTGRLRDNSAARSLPGSVPAAGQHHQANDKARPARASSGKHRLIWRVPAVLALAVLALGDLLLCVWLVDGRSAKSRRGLWAENWNGKFLRLLGVRVRTNGEPPHHGLVVANHPNPLDHLVLASRQPLVFAPGASSETPATANPFRRFLGHSLPTLETLAHQVVVVFPEAGPSQDGAAAPFLPARLAFASTGTMTAIPARLEYLTRDGQRITHRSVAALSDSWSSWWAMLQQPPLDAFVTYGRPIRENGNRTLWARRLREAVLTLGQSPVPANTPHDPASPTAPTPPSPAEGQAASAASPQSL